MRLWPFTKQQKDLEFIDTSDKTYTRFPILRAKDVKPLCYEHQKSKYGKVQFPKCPGMIDYAQLGYIITAHVDINIMANKAGVLTSVGSQQRGDGGFQKPRRMESAILDGYATADGVEPVPLLLDLPWKIFTPHNMSAIVLPALYHSDFLDDLSVWAGVVDYNKFHTLNFIFSPKRECNITIKAGTPILQIIPFINQEISAGYGPGTPEQRSLAANQIPSGDTQFYRKFYMQAKKYFLSEKSK